MSDNFCFNRSFFYIEWKFLTIKFILKPQKFSSIYREKPWYFVTYWLTLPIYNILLQKPIFCLERNLQFNYLPKNIEFQATELTKTDILSTFPQKKLFSLMRINPVKSIMHQTKTARVFYKFDNFFFWDNRLIIFVSFKKWPYEQKNSNFLKIIGSVVILGIFNAFLKQVFKVLA